MTTAANGTGKPVDGIFSLLDTDLYKLTMQCCVLKYFPDTKVSYNYTNRTPHKKFNREGADWLKKQVDNLAELRLTSKELEFLRSECPYLTKEFLAYIQTFAFRPSEQIEFEFKADSETSSPAKTDQGSIILHVKGLWLETILYEIPLLALISEAYFKFCDTEWNYDGQVENAKAKGLKLIDSGCVFSEFGSRRRRDYHAQDLVNKGLVEAAKELKDGPGKLSGTSNVHFAMKYGIPPVGTVAHEWFMGVAAVTGDYENANELSLKYWVGTFGPGVLGIALTDTFGTRAFLESFRKPIESDPEGRTYAEVFTGVRQDSGDPMEFIKVVNKFYSELPDHKPKHKPVCVFSDSLDVEKCIHYREESLKLGFDPTFGVGTFLTNDFKNIKTGEKSVPLNIVIKIDTAGGHPAVKISDNIGKNTGDMATVEDVKKRLGYVEKNWGEGDEKHRWD